MLAISAGGVFGNTIPRRSTSRCIVSRGSISTRPRLPIIATRPPFARMVRSFPRFTFASNSTDHINTAPGRCVHDLLELVRRAMIEHFVRALFTRELASLVTTRRAEHAQTASARQLNRRRPDTAARAVNEHCFTRLSVGALKQPAIRGRVGRAHG